MGAIILITGGCRSGKSSLAQHLAELIDPPRIFVATGIATDEEMMDRIRRHQEARAARGWNTLEESVELAGVLAYLPSESPVVVDCLSLWINNLMWAAPTSRVENQGECEVAAAMSTLSEQEVAIKCADIIEVCRSRSGPTIFVTNEVGMGVVPGTAAGRLFRDLLGRCNQVMAQEADLVVLMISGLPCVIKSLARTDEQTKNEVEGYFRELVN
ncbi:MAG: bifunctional adenosylcobinamide kinase/adenosylcobinamide-phosphate guanylyltransferase [Thermoleophilia bacterium]|nr:bifunctional adenosylcobinamide kinase/adenosylcobinamide-phosphate guanylyltransferase [Thermoleophilia bacterium]